MVRAQRTLRDYNLDRPVLAPRESGLRDAGFVPLGRLPALRAEFETWSTFCIDTLFAGEGTDR